MIVVEGIDAAGKGGMIRRTTELMDPRGYRVHPIGAPSKKELVERVDKLINEATWQRAYREIREFEEQLVNDDVTVIKLFLSISKEEQLRRFKERMEEPRKRWKITPDDILNRQNWDDYQYAFEDMLTKTNGERRDWHIVGANNKKHARLDAMQHIAKRLSEQVDIEEVQLLNPEVQKLAEKHL